MRNLVLILALSGCGAQAKAIEHAEIKCLEQDLISLGSKLSAAAADPVGVALQLTAGELTCASEALSAKAAAGSAASAPVPADAGTP